jgi:hypothetical protein
LAAASAWRPSAATRGSSSALIDPASHGRAVDLHADARTHAALAVQGTASLRRARHLATLEKIEDDIRKVLADPEIVKLSKTQVTDITGLGQADFASVVNQGRLRAPGRADAQVRYQERVKTHGACVGRLPLPISPSKDKVLPS